MIRFALLAVCLAGVAAPTRAVSPNPVDLVIPQGELLRAKSLISILGSEIYQDRESAERTLAKMGRLAGPVLRETLQSSVDPEVRIRAARLLSRAEAEDLKARTETFLADVEGRYEHAMPGWAIFRRYCGVDYELFGLKLATDSGASKQARELFVEMLKSKPATNLLTAMDVGGEGLGKAAGDLRYQMFVDQNPGILGQVPGGNGGQPKNPTIADFTALLCAETMLQGKTNARVGPFFIMTSMFLQTPAIMPAIQGKGPYATIFRRVLGHWFRYLTDVNELQQAMYTVMQFNIREALPAVRRTVTTPGAQIHLRAQAIGVLAKLGGKDELPTLQKLVKDDTTVQPNRFPNKMDLQIRDVALAMCVIVTGQDVQQYGYELQQKLNDNIKYQYWTFAFRSPEKRAEGLKKWDEWEKAQSKK